MKKLRSKMCDSSLTDEECKARRRFEAALKDPDSPENRKLALLQAEADRHNAGWADAA